MEKTTTQLAAEHPAMVQRLKAHPDEIVYRIGEDWNTVRSRHRNIELMHAAIGLSTEVGELFTAFHEHRGKINVIEELGDCEWYRELARAAINGPQPDSVTPELWGSETGTVEKLAIAASDFLDDVKKLVFYGRDPDRWEERLHAIDRPLAGLYMILFTNREEVLAANVRKLTKRYGDKWSAEAEANRDLAAEEAAIIGDHDGGSR